MKKTRLISFGALFLLINSIHALPADSDFFRNSFYRGDILFTLDKDSYKAGEEINLSLTVANMENFPLTDVYVVVEVVRGGEEHIYPSQFSDIDNVIYEEVVGGFILPPLSQKNVAFLYEIPKELDSGMYRIEAYVVTKTAPIVGIPSIFLAPKSAVFVVEGQGSYLSAHIDRMKTFFRGENLKQNIPKEFLTPVTPDGSDDNLAGPIGVGVTGGDEVSGVVYIKSDSDSEVGGLKLRVSVCENEDAICFGKDFLVVEEYPVPVVLPHAEGKIDVSFRAPDKPGSYAIRLELLDEKKRMLSLYRSKIVVKGEAARIVKANVDRLYYSNGSGGRIDVLVLGSPDIYTKPNVSNARLSVSIKQDEQVCFSDSYVIPLLSYELDDGVFHKSFSFKTACELITYKVCSKIESSRGELFDEYCFSISPQSEFSGVNKFSATWDYNYKTNSLVLDVCSTNLAGMPSNSKTTVVLLEPIENKVAYIKSGINLVPCSNLSISVPEADYLLVLTEEETSRQFVFQVSVKNRTGETLSPNVVCGDGICSKTESKENCCVDCGCPKGFDCLNNSCVQQTYNAICGDGRCGGGETSSSCCIDCGCSLGECVNGKCISAEEEKPVEYRDNTHIFIGLGITVVIMLLIYFYGFRGGRK